MKKIILITIFALATLFTSVNTYAQVTSQQEVELRQEDSTNLGPRALIQVPSVWIDKNLCQLSVRFNKPLSYFTLIVIDPNQSVIFQSPLISDGSVQLYNLMLVYSGIYTVIIRGEDGVFTGEFDYQRISHGNKHF